jgi:hypothetical protein
LLSVILANCVILAMSINAPGFGDTDRGKVLSIIDNIFLGIFILEAALKIVALGFLMGPGSYLQNGRSNVLFSGGIRTTIETCSLL